MKRKTRGRWASTKASKSLIPPPRDGLFVSPRGSGGGAVPEESSCLIRPYRPIRGAKGLREIARINSGFRGLGGRIERGGHNYGGGGLIEAGFLSRGHAGFPGAGLTFANEPLAGE